MIGIAILLSGLVYAIGLPVIFVMLAREQKREAEANRQAEARP